MRQTLSRGVVAAAAATSILSLYGSPAIAESHGGGTATDSPGVLSGNNVSAPIEVPVNACGDSVDVIAPLNPTFGNSCASGHGSHKSGHHAGHRHGGHDRGYGDDSSCESDGGYGGDCEETPPPTKPPTKPPVTTPPVTTPPVTTPPVTGPPATTPPVTTPPATTPPATYPPTTPPETTPPTTTPPVTTPPTTGPPATTPPATTPPATTPPGTTPPATYPPATTPPATTPPGTTPPTTAPPTTPPHLPHTGSNGEAMLGASGLSAAMIVAGAVLYRRGRTASHR